MKKIRQTKLYLCVILVVAIVAFANLNMAYAEPTEQEAKDKLNQITSEEELIIEKLFVLSSEIELLQTQTIQIEEKIKTTNSRIETLSTNIIEMEQRYGTLKSNLGEVLKIQQRSGVASSVEVIFSSKSLKDFIYRINLLRDLSKKVDGLMIDTLNINVALESEKVTFEEVKLDLENQKTDLANKISDKAKAKLELEDYLENLSSEKSHYEAYLKSIESLWNSLKPLFTKTIASFNQLIRTGGLPEDTVELNLSLFNTTGTIRESKFNAVLALQKDFPKLQFDFRKDAVLLAFPEYEIELEGNFVLLDNQTIQYAVTGGTFYKLPMSQSAILDLFSEGDMIFQLKSLLGKNTIKRIDQYEDKIVMQITISLF